MRKVMLIVALAGMTGCVATNDAGLCIVARQDVAALRTALEDHPETPAPVGEAGTDLVIGIEGACGR